MSDLMEDEDGILRDAESNDPYDFAEIYYSEVETEGSYLVVKVNGDKYLFCEITLQFERREEWGSSGEF